MPAFVDVIEQGQLAWYQRATATLFVLLVACSFVGAFAYKLRADGIFACPASGYGSNAYLADCTLKSYGDYDHGAFWFGLEPRALRAAVEADVLLLGSSRLQFGFSGTAAASWFSAAGVRHYLLGFTHTENVAFVGPLLSKIRPRAKVYVINVDRFFDDRLSWPAERIVHDRDILERYKEKRMWQSLHKGFCIALPVTCGTAPAVYRTRDTGAWTRMGIWGFETTEVSDGQPSGVERWDHYVGIGEKFLAQLPVDRDCVILTIVPTVETKRAEAKAIAARLGHDLLAPLVDHLRTFDGSHLDEPSAERWSAAFLREAGPRIRNCVGAAKASSG